MRRLRILSGYEVCRILERFGFIAAGQRGSHRIMQSRTEDTTLAIRIRLQDPLKRGTLSSTVRQSGLPRSHFETE